MVRYRHYYTTRHPNGSRTVVSTGGVTNGLNGMWIFIFKLFYWGWPAGTVYDGLKGGLGMGLAIVAEVIWLPIAVWIVNAYRRHQNP